MFRQVRRAAAKMIVRRLLRSDRRMSDVVDEVLADRRSVPVLVRKVLANERTFRAFLQEMLSTGAEHLSSVARQTIDLTDVGMHNESGRDKWLQGTLAKVPAGWRILDAGAGERKYEKFCGHLNYVSQDLAEYRGTGDGAGLQVGSWVISGIDIVSDIAEIPQPDGSFDAVMCTEVLEHIPDPLRALREFTRLLRSGGKLILTSPFCSLTHFSPNHYSTGFSRYYFEIHLNALGFEIEQMVPNGNYFDYLAQEIRRLGYVADRYAQTTRNKAEELAAAAVLHVLDGYSETGAASSELLCFGWLVVARKKAESTK